MRGITKRVLGNSDAQSRAPVPVSRRDLADEGQR